MPEARFHDSMARKHVLDLLRPGGGTQVEVLGGTAQKEVPNTAPHNPGLIARPLEDAQGRVRLGRQRQLHGRTSLAGWKKTPTQVPLPSWLSRSTLALWQAAACLTIDSPRPVPPISLEWLLSTR